jgi:phosphatidylglycerophosphate synthase
VLLLGLGVLRAQLFGALGGAGHLRRRRRDRLSRRLGRAHLRPGDDDRPHAPGLPLATWTGHLLLWLAALLTLYTGWDYFRAGAEHLSDDRP